MGHCISKDNLERVVVESRWEKDKKGILSWVGPLMFKTSKTYLATRRSIHNSPH